MILRQGRCGWLSLVRWFVVDLRCVSAAAILIFLSSGQVRAQENWQSLTEKVTLQGKDVELSVLVRQLETQSHHAFIYSGEQLKGIRIQMISFEKQPLGQVLAYLVAHAPIDVSLVGNTVGIRRVATPGMEKGPGLPVTGQVTDTGGMPLRGVTVQVKGMQRSAVTDENGRFSINVPDDKTVLVFTHTGYQRVEMKAGTGMIRVRMAQQVRSLSEVVVEARRKGNTEAQILNERRVSAVVSDAISAQHMAKTASITTTQALQRVTGVTITDDKYVAIRGLGDRSVIAELNGARLSSANPDRSAVPLDLVPASLLDNVTIYKTMSPDRPADASAGLIELKTKSVPDSMTVSFGAAVGFNSTIGLDGGKYNAFTGYYPGFLGENIPKKDLAGSFLALNKQYPGGNDQIYELFANSRRTGQLAAEAYRINKIMLSLPPVITTSYQTAQPNQIYDVSFGNTFRVLGDHELGVILSANYYVRTEDRYHAQLNQYSIYQGVLTGSPKIYAAQHIPNYSTPDLIQLGKYLGYQENTGSETINYGFLAGLTYRFNSRNEVQFQYVGSRGAEVGGSSLTGAYQNTGLDYAVYNQINQLVQSYRTFNTLNLQGEHKIVNTSWSPRLSYNLSSSISTQDDPDFRFTDVADAHKERYVDQNGVGVTSDYYAFVVGSVHGIGPTDSITADPNGRRFRYLRERNVNTKADLTEPIRIGKQVQELKIGVNYLHRSRTFTENVLGLPGTDQGGDNGLLQKYGGDLSALVSYKNVGLSNPANYDAEGATRTGGFLYQIRKSPNNYTGTYETMAGYGMVDAHISSQWRLVAGVRFENTSIAANVDTTGIFDVVSGSDTNRNLQPNTSYRQGYKPFFSGNLIYTYRKNMNFRLAANNSVARPELREITNIYEFDPFQFAVIVGNPNLINQTTTNFDFRWEWFPHTGEVFSVSAFYKQIRNQLTKVFVYNTPGNEAQSPEYPIVEFINDPDVGKVYGLELEARKNLGIGGWPFAHVFAGANVLLDYSVITKNPDRLDKNRIIDRHASTTSPIFEQAPYAVNAFLDYDNQRIGTTVTASFNIVGERLVQVQLDGAPDIYSRPVPILDLVFSQHFWKRFMVKGFAKNLLNPAYREVYATPGTNGKYYGQTYIRHQYYRGSEYSLGITYNLF